jgi:ubiquinone biosynthesis protein UbiJ
MDAPRTLFQPVVAMMNRQIAVSTPARELCAELDGRTFAVQVRDSSLSIALSVRDDGVVIDTGLPTDADVVVSGSLPSLVRLAGPTGESLIRDGTVELKGDAIIAQRFRRLLRFARPDLEEELSRVTGDIVAHSAGDALRRVANWGREVRATMRQNVAEYLVEEREAVPRRFEVDEFRDELGRLRDDVARFEARLKQLESAAGQRA